MKHLPFYTLAIFGALNSTKAETSAMVLTGFLDAFFFSFNKFLLTAQHGAK